MAIKPFRADSGVQMATGSASWRGPNGVAGVYYKTGIGLVARNVDNSETTLGAGGGGSSTLKLTYAAGTAPADSIMALDSTRGQLILTDAGSSIGSLFTIRNNAATNNYFNINATAAQLIKSGMSDGASAIALTVDTTSAWANASARLLSLRNGGTERVGFQLNAMSFPANFNFSCSSAATTNTTSISLLPNVADGATSVALRINAVTALANATASLFTLQNAATTLMSTRLNSTDGVKLVDGGGGTALSLSTATGASLAYGTARCAVNSGTVVLADGTATLTMTAGAATLAATQLVADADGTRDLGLVATRWRTVAGKRIVRGTQFVAFSATPALDPAACNVIHVGPITANVTAPTMTAGAAGESCTIIWLKDGTAGTFTIGGWGANVRFNGVATFAAGASAIIVQQFTWDDRLGVPAWVLTSTQPVV